MKSYKLLVLLFIPLLFSSFYAHKYYLSVTDIVYNQEAKAIQIVSRVFYDDLEAVLQERYDSNIVVDATANQEKLDAYLPKYITKKIKISVNGITQKLDFLGKEYEDDYVVCYIEAVDVASINSLEIENTLLMDLYEGQKNMIHTQILGKKKSLLLHDGNITGMLNFSE